MVNDRRRLLHNKTLQQAAAAIQPFRSTLAHSAAAAAELFR